EALSARARRTTQARRPHRRTRQPQGPPTGSAGGRNTTRGGDGRSRRRGTRRQAEDPRRGGRTESGEGQQGQRPRRDRRENRLPRDSGEVRGATVHAVEGPEGQGRHGGRRG